MYKAILVDDEKIVRLALKTIVDWTALGYTVTGSYSSVKTALLEIEDDPPDLIITDIKMPPPPAHPAPPAAFHENHLPS